MYYTLRKHARYMDLFTVLTIICDVHAYVHDYQIVIDVLA